MAFAERLTAPDKTNQWYYSNTNPYYKNGYGMPNCTAYAWGRFSEIQGKSAALYYGNAENWFNNTTAYSRGGTPQLGAVICWQKGNTQNASDGAGHVAIVERVNADGSILTSNSNYKGTNFYTKTLTPANNYYAGTGYAFQGFIYPSSSFGLRKFKIYPPIEKTVSSQLISEGTLAIKDSEGNLRGYNVLGDARMAREFDNANKSSVFEGLVAEMQPGEIIMAKDN